MTDTLNNELENTAVTFTGRAGEAISAGSLVWVDKAATEITRTGSLDGNIDVMKCDTAGDELKVAGVCMQTTASGSNIPVATHGLFRFRVSAAVSAGSRVQGSGSTDPFEVKTLADATTNAGHLGKALTEATTDGEYILVLVNIS